MTFEDKNESYAGGFAPGLGDDTDDGTVGGSGGGVETGGNAFSSGFGCSVKTLMYFKSVPNPKTTAVSPYGNFIDVSSMDQKLLWREMVKSDADFVPLDITVAKCKVIIDLFTDNAITFRWMRFLRIPIIGDGTAGSTPNRTPSGGETYNANLSVFKNLIKDFNHLTLNDVMAFAFWFMGDLTTPRSVCPPTDITMKYLDVNASGNNGLVACFKQECCAVSCWYGIPSRIISR
jgi:hypothetical protein